MATAENAIGHAITGTEFIEAAITKKITGSAAAIVRAGSRPTAIEVTAKTTNAAADGSIWENTLAAVRIMAGGADTVRENVTPSLTVADTADEAADIGVPNPSPIADATAGARRTMIRITAAGAYSAAEWADTRAEVT